MSWSQHPGVRAIAGTVVGISLVNALVSLKSIFVVKNGIPLGFALFLLLIPVLVNLFLALGILKLKWWARVLVLILSAISLLSTLVTFMQSLKTWAAWLLLAVNTLGSGWVLFLLVRSDIIALFNQNPNKEEDVLGLSPRVRGWLLRLVALNSLLFVLSTAVLRVKNALNLSQDMRGVLVVYLFITLAAFLYLLIYLFVHWSRQPFRSKGAKYFWLTCLILGLLWHFVGHFIYYLFVVEGKKTLRPAGAEPGLPASGVSTPGQS